MKVVVLSALGNEAARRCIDSLLKSAPSTDFDLYLVRERGFREQTLNFALSLAGTNDDLLFVGDDIEFTPGWHEALVTNYCRGDILGMCMLYPDTDKVQDRGYDLVQVDDRITLEAMDRGARRGEIEPFGTRFCDALCGCFMLVKAGVFALVPGFSEEGQNRWGEFIFASQARQSGATVAVIDHFLYHGGQSTKSNPDKALSSISYQVERDIWQDIAQRYVDPADVRIRLRSGLEPGFRARLEDESRRMLFYGIGTVSEFLLNETQPDPARVAFCSGLPEEVGLEFYGQEVLAANQVDLRRFDCILMTPLYIGERLFRQVLLPRIPRGFVGTVSVVEVERLARDLVYRCRPLPL